MEVICIRDDFQGFSTLIKTQEVISQNGSPKKGEIYIVYDTMVANKILYLSLNEFNCDKYVHYFPAMAFDNITNLTNEINEALKKSFRKPIHPRPKDYKWKLDLDEDDL